jgi:hypothetical protein
MAATENTRAPDAGPADPGEVLEERVGADHYRGVSTSFNNDGAGIDHWRTRDGIRVARWPLYAIETEPLEYAYNSWLPNDDRDPRSEGIWIGTNEDWPRTGIVLAFHGKDVHSATMTPEQARNLAEALLGIADYLEATRPEDAS